MEKIRLGVIGCGKMAGSHAHAYKQLEDVMRLTAVCDIVPERMENAASLLGVDVAVTDYRDLLDHVDAVLIALPHDLHFEVGMTCLKAGKHVLMEKPMCNTEEECITLIRTAEQEKRVLMTAYPIRWIPLIAKMKEIIDSGKVGELFQFSIWTEQYTKPEEGSWIRSADRLGGGQFFSHGCHYIDLMLWFMGKPVRGMHMGTNFGTPWMEAEGTSNVVIEFENGALGYHMGTWGARGTRLGYSFHAHCTKGMLEVKAKDEKLYFHNRIKEERADFETSSEVEVLMEMPNMGKFTHFEIRHFLECIATGKKPVTDGPTSLQGLRVIWRLYDAERKKVAADLRGLGLDEDWTAVPPSNGAGQRTSRVSS